MKCSSFFLHPVSAAQCYVHPLTTVTFTLQILNPFYVFQAFTLTLWLSQGYTEYSVAIIVLSIISVGLTVYDLRQVSAIQPDSNFITATISSYFCAFSGYLLLLCILMYCCRFITTEE